MDPKIVKKTQDTLGKIIKKPPLTDKLLGKPPFRFLHDIMTSVIKTAGFMQGLYTDTEMNSENVKDKDAKIAFLQKAIDMVSAVTGQELSVRPVKIVAGHEPEKTNEFLQALAAAINKNVDNDKYVKKVLEKGDRGGGSAKGEKREERKEKEGSAEKKKSRDHEEKDKHDREEKKERSRDKADREGDKKHDRDRHDRDKEKERDRHKDRDRDSKSRDSKSRDKSREERHKDRDRERSKREQSREKENESPDRDKVNGEKEEKHEPPSRLQRPSSAKGSRRRREEDEEFQKTASHEPMMGEGDLPPQVAAARQLARPSSARPAPPRPKQEAHESEPAMRLGTGQPTNLIVDDDNEDEDENFLVEESAPPPPEPDPTPLKPPDEDDAEHGALVKKMLESKKELEGGSQAGPAKKTEIERPLMSDAQRRKQRELVQKEIEKLRASIQSLTRSANPLGKVMDYVQEDMDSMQQELDKWRSENAQHALDLKREMSVTDRAIDPLRQQLAELDRAIGDQLDRIAALKANTIKNDQKIHKMLHGISSS